jgi:hypothetical protein
MHKVPTGIFISPISPFDLQDGWSIGAQSDLAAFSNVATVSHVFYYLNSPNSNSSGRKGILEAGSFRTTRLPVRSGGKVVRTLRALRSAVPPSSERFYSTLAFSTLAECLCDEQPSFVFLHDAAMAGFIETIRSLCPASRIILRMNNIMTEVARVAAEEIPWYLRPAALFEWSRWRGFEKRAIQKADVVISVTSEEQSKVHELYSVKTSLVPLAIQLGQYVSLPLTRPEHTKLLHLGTIDERRRCSIENFLSRDLRALRQIAPQLEIVFAGNCTTDIQWSRYPGARYVGPVNDDLAVLSRYRHVLNLQTSPGGVKLKSMVALASGCVLWSSEEGVAGLRIVEGKHYLSLNRLSAFAAGAMTSYEFDRIVEQGRAVASEQFGLAGVVAMMRGCLHGAKWPD